MDKLSDEQVKEFDREYVSQKRWQPIQQCIDTDFPDGKFTFLDLGGGNGRFADRVLAAYPESTGTVLDSSQVLLDLNSPSNRKRVVLGDAAELELVRERYDIVFCNWLLHHLVSTGSYHRTQENILSTLKCCREHVLAPRGRLSVYENDYEGLIDGFPGRMIFEVTSLKIVAPLTRRLGANTAGVGVCFSSSRKWKRIFRSAGFDVERHTQDRKKARLPVYARLAFLIRAAPRGHYWLRPVRG